MVSITKRDRTEKLGITLPLSLLKQIDNKRGDIPPDILPICDDWHKILQAYSLMKFMMSLGYLTHIKFLLPEKTLS